MSQMPHRYWLSEKRTASCFSPNSVWIPGDWMSVSTTPTRWPSAASSAATLAAAFDLPVPPRNEWTEMILDIVPLLCIPGCVLLLGVRAKAKRGGLGLEVLEVFGL